VILAVFTTLTFFQTNNKKSQMLLTLINLKRTLNKPDTFVFSTNIITTFYQTILTNQGAKPAQSWCRNDIRRE
jgi:hypothetical protein